MILSYDIIFINYHIHSMIHDHRSFPMMIPANTQNNADRLMQTKQKEKQRIKDLFTSGVHSDIKIQTGMDCNRIMNVPSS